MSQLLLPELRLLTIGLFPGTVGGAREGLEANDQVAFFPPFPPLYVLITHFEDCGDATLLPLVVRRSHFPFGFWLD